MTWKVHLGDCLDVMRTLPECSVDAIVTDPPYGLAFLGKAWDHAVPGPEFVAEMLRVAKPGAHLFAFGGTRLYHRMTCAIEDAGWEVRDCLSWLYGSGFPKSLAIDKAIDSAAGATREATLETTREARASATVNFEGRASWERARFDAPATPQAATWQGYGTALKPAWEPIVLAMKPTDGTFAANAEKWGVAGLHIDGGRIAIADGDSWNVPAADMRRVNPARAASANGSPGAGRHESQRHTPRLGRWPANLVLDEEAAAMLDAEAPHSSSTRQEVKSKPGGIYGGGGRLPSHTGIYGFNDSGGPSRFFYTGKASSEERTDNNTHPTVKPTDLMRGLVRLAKPPGGGVILDPFTGSGSTGVACVLEGCSFIGIEREPEYQRIAEARIARAMKTGPEVLGKTEDGRTVVQRGLFE